MIASSLHERLSAKPPVSPVLLQEKMQNAERKRKERLDKLVMREKAKVKRAKFIAAETRRRRAESSLVKQAQLDDKLDAAAARRALSRASSPMSSPLARPAKRFTAEAGLTLPPSITLAVACEIGAEIEMAVEIETPIFAKEIPSGKPPGAFARLGDGPRCRLVFGRDQPQPPSTDHPAPAADQAVAKEAVTRGAAWPPKEADSGPVVALEAGAEAEEEKDKDMESTHTLLLAQLEAACAQGEVAGDLGFVTWMKAPAALDLVASWLAEMHISPTHARVLLGLLYMAHDAAEVFEAEDEQDRCMRREAERFAAKLRAQLARGSAAAAPEAFESSFHRARRFHSAWARHDVPKQAQQAEEMLRGMQRRLMQVRQRQAQAGAALEPPEDLLVQIGALGGPEAEAEARRVYSLPWEVVDGATLEARVREVAMRAMWDSVQAQVESGEYSGLFSLLGELQQAMSALVAHSPRAREALADRFDAKWIAQQAAAEALSLEDVHRLIAYLLDEIGGWQAPVDDDDMRAWAAQVHGLLASSRDLALEVFISRHLVGILQQALERVGRVYQRVNDMALRTGAAAPAAA